MPAKIDEHWGAVIDSIKGEHQNWGAGRTYQELKKKAEANEIGDYPSERWVGKYLRDIWEIYSEEQKRQHFLVFWPGSMEVDALPWEASAAALELLAYRNDIGEDRPNHREALWFWRVTQAAPNAPLSFRYGLSIILAWRPAMGYPIPPGLEMALAHAGPYRQSSPGAGIPPMDDLNERVQDWLGFADIDGHGPDPVIRVYFGQEATEFLTAREALNDTEDQNE